MTSTVEELWQQCRQEWPTIEFPLDRFAARLASLDTTSRFLPDLYLSWACLEGTSGALDAFEQHCRSTVRACVRRTSIAAHRIPEVEQRLRELLFVGGANSTPALSGYTGRGSLRGWVGVVAARQAMRLMGATHREVAVANDVIDDLVGPTRDPELEHLKQVYRQEFAAAFRQALAELEPRQRTVLKQRYLDKVEVNQLAKLHRTHRATVSRWLSDARHQLAKRTQALLAQQLGISPGECESVMRLIESKLEATFGVLEG